MKASIEKLPKILDLLTGAVAYIGDACLIIMTLLISFEVIARDVFNSPTGFSDEIAAYLLMGVIFLVASQALKQNKFVVVTLLYDKLSAKARLYMDVTIHLLSLFAWSMLTIQVLRMVRRSYEQPAASDVLRVPSWLPQLIILLGVALVLIQTAVLATRAILLVSHEKKRVSANSDRKLATP